LTTGSLVETIRTDRLVERGAPIDPDGVVVFNGNFKEVMLNDLVNKFDDETPLLNMTFLQGAYNSVNLNESSFTLWPVLPPTEKENGTTRETQHLWLFRSTIQRVPRLRYTYGCSRSHRNRSRLSVRASCCTGLVHNSSANEDALAEIPSQSRCRRTILTVQLRIIPGCKHKWTV
jgi:hypothetical protein